MNASQAAHGARADDLVKQTPYGLAGVMSAASAGDGAVSAQPGARGAASGGSRRRWLILAVIATAQLMVVLDMTVVNIALPSAQKALHFTNADRQWIITGYALAFGSLLLLGGKLADLLGRKQTFLAGLIGFAAASALGGAATGFGMLVVARVCQGVFGALLAPAGLSLLTTTFPGKKERGTAFGVYGGIVGSGSAVGLLLGGVLTEYLSWRWCLYINVVFAAAGVTGGALLLSRQPSPQRRPRLDLPGAVSVSAAMFCLVYGFSNADTHSWHTPSTWGFLAAGVAGLAVFIVRQARAAHPLLPLRIILDRNRGGSYLAVFLVMAGASGVFLFLTYYLQDTRGYSPVATGLAYLPMLVTALAISIASNVVLLPRTGPKPLVAVGMLLVAAGMVWLTRIGLHSGYAAAILGPLLISGAGMGLVVSPSMNTATYGVPPADAGVASATANTQQQIGTSIGTALLNTLAVSATTRYLTSHLTLAGGRLGTTLTSLALVHGYTTAFWWAAGILVAGAVICGTLLRPGVLAGQGDSQPDTPASQKSAALPQRIFMNDAERRGGSRHSGMRPGTLSPIRCRLGGNGMLWTRCSGAAGRISPPGSCSAQNFPAPDFVLWGDKVLARIKKVLSRAPAIAPYIYASADALRWIEQDDVTGNDLAFRKTGTDR